MTVNITAAAAAAVAAATTTHPRARALMDEKGLTYTVNTSNPKLLLLLNLNCYHY